MSGIWGLNKPNLKYLRVTSVVFFVKLLDHQGFDRYEVKIEKLEFFKQDKDIPHILTIPIAGTISYNCKVYFVSSPDAML